MSATKDADFSESLPRRIRISSGTAVVIGLAKGKLDAAPTTAYLMTYRRGKCSANCSFCPQARESRSKADLLSRITWPSFETDIVLDCLKGAITGNRMSRVCIQALNYRNAFKHIYGIVRAIHKVAEVAISVSCQPPNRKSISRIAESGVQRIGIPLDAATEAVFDRVKGRLVGGPYDWNKQYALLRDAVQIFGKGRVSTHLIAGLGETEREMVNAVQHCWDMGVLPALFAFTPVQGTVLEGRGQPSIHSYRRLQIARYSIVHGLVRAEDMKYGRNGRLVDFGLAKDTFKAIVLCGEPFLTSGCPDCNRPYYNEKPSGPIYNFPRRLSATELADVVDEVKTAVK